MFLNSLLTHHSLNTLWHECLQAKQTGKNGAWSYYGTCLCLRVKVKKVILTLYLDISYLILIYLISCSVSFYLTIWLYTVSHKMTLLQINCNLIFLNCNLVSQLWLYTIFCNVTLYSISQFLLFHDSIPVLFVIIATLQYIVIS